MKSAEYQQRVRECAAEIGTALPGLADRHTPLILIAALTEQVGGAIRIGRHERACTDQEAKDIIERMRQIAFAESDAAPNSGPPASVPSGR